ncbi:hypothetical protein B0T26DRAFT_222982 [Lasiosphaeria miniovina]|uniref:DUF7729 domain-containing protein n=1 Tax=Lasiosphaeria miniovina TaxID=1954250 RepID=A0AA40AV35_9PEZI|nr:uncharacterized protein B0T26DRAFT_222982 [Lasiosphaeria miniovina]KAK0722513.1 hypothetical protein B0T26DRAFT_222982 [Lasiosphaeria miniovina]
MMASAIPLPLSPGRRVSAVLSPSQSVSRQPRTSWAAVLAILACLVCHALALTADAAEPLETLVIDTRVPYRIGQSWNMLSPEEVELHRLGKRATTSTTPQVFTTTFEIAVSTVTPDVTNTAPLSALPSPLDGALSANFTPNADNTPSTCAMFINSFLTDPTFKQCYPLSLLLQGSKSFFDAEKSLVGITQTLDATCRPNATFCNTYLSSLAQNLTSTQHCGNDYNLGNSVVIQAHLAMIAYAPLYSAGCLKDPQTSAYCFATAVRNTTNFTNTYFYFLPLNMSLPGSTLPTCGVCTQQTMEVYHVATANRQQPVVNNYVAAAKQVNTICGPGFVNETLADQLVAASTSFAPARPAASSAWLYMTVPLLAMLQWLL